jgi:cobaltochelatase CobN
MPSTAPQTALGALITVSLCAVAACLAVLAVNGQAAAHGEAGHAHRVSLLIIDADSYLVNKAVQSLKLPADLTVRFFLHGDLAADQAAQRFVTESDVIIIDVMGPELTKWLIDHIEPEVRPVYALRGSRDDEGLRRRGLIFDESVKVYFDHLSAANIRNLIYRVIHQELDPAVAFEPLVKQPEIGIYHPDSEVIFDTAGAFRQWYRRRPGFRAADPWVGIMFFPSNLIDGQRRPFAHIVRRLEQAGLNVMACFGRDRKVIETFLLDDNRRARVDLVLAFSLKFYSAMDDDLRRALADLDVPVLDAINLYSDTISGWRDNPVGIPPLETVWAIAVPEMSAVAEPTPLAGKVRIEDEAAGKTVYAYYPIEETLEHLIPRIRGWLNLRRKANVEKRLAVLYYNHSQGKQNIGASYLNVFASLEAMLARLDREGYRIGEGLGMSATDIRDAILRNGRNVGSWAPGELDRMLAGGTLVRLPLATYADWFEQLPATFRRAVVDQWGPPDTARIMVQDGHFIIPAVIRGNLVLMPEPARGWADAPMKLYHDTTLYPHHQYIAAYLWLKHGFQADAVIHLGTHATHEWLPGKQAGLAPSDPPEVLLTDLPNLYPYIVDNIGEGLQAKRRGRGVVVDHLIPPLTAAGLYEEYAELQEKINAYHRAVSQGSDTAAEELKRIAVCVRETGIDMDLHTSGDHRHPGEDHDTEPAAGHHHADHAHSHHHAGHRHVGPDGRLVVDDALIHDLEHYLTEIKATLMPYGMHTFGRSPAAAAAGEMAAAVAATHAENTPQQVAAALAASGPREMDHLVNGLKGRYVPPGEGNDPIRNIKSIPTGNNFYGFSPDKVPSRAAWELGKQAAQQIIDRHLDQKGGYPRKVAVVLWATETIRNQGVNESTILYLLGMAPTWDRTGRISGSRPIAGPQLGRPRIDVLINPSGLYRDLFPHMIHFIDAAVRTAAVQTDIENLIAAHTAQIEKELKAAGLSAEAARAMAAVRIFSEPPGSYGNGVSELTSASSYWDSDMDIVRVYRNRVGFAFGGGMWGRPARTVLRRNLKDVDVAVHSRSSQLYGLLDNDDVFQYLGGLSLAVARERGAVPDTFIADQRTPGRITVEDVARSLGREMRTRYFNPKWIAGMQAENYAGAREMSNFVDYLWGWQVTTPTAVDAAKWEQVYAVYVQDKYNLDLKEFFNRVNPWAYQSLSARMLEAVRKQYWPADEAVTRKLAVEYAVNVAQKGVACCDHTCNNPLLNQMVANLISLPGVVAPEIVEQFKLALARMAEKPLTEQVARRQSLIKELEKARPSESSPAAADAAPAEPAKVSRAEGAPQQTPDSAETVEGYKLEDVKTEDDTTQMTSSGVQWIASLFVVFIIGLFVWGLRLRRGEKQP